jgi:shikimate kinase
MTKLEEAVKKILIDDFSINNNQATSTNTSGDWVFKYTTTDGDMAVSSLYSDIYTAKNTTYRKATKMLFKFIKKTLKKKPRDIKIELLPTNMKSFKEHQEASVKSVNFAFDNFSIPTNGHASLIEELASNADGDQYRIFDSNSSSVLSYVETVQLMRKVFPKHGRNIVLSEDTNSMKKIIDHLVTEGFTKGTLYVDANEVECYIDIINENRDRFVDGLSIHSVELSENHESTSSVMESVAVSNFLAFAQEIPNSFGNKQGLFNLYRRRLGLSEQLSFRSHVDLEKIDVRERYINGDVFNVGDIFFSESREMLSVQERCQNHIIGSDDKKYFINKIEEGVDDPAIFKAVFLAGGPGSGKSFTVGKTALTALGFKLVNSDPAFERGIKKAGGTMDPEFIFSPKGQDIRVKAKALTTKQLDLYLNGRLGLIIDGTGKDFKKITDQADAMKALGYDVSMIFVNTDLQTAINRDLKRSRTVGVKKLTPMWQRVQNNIGKFQAYFRDNFIIVDNSDGANIEKATLDAYKKMAKFSNKLPTSKIARTWIKKMKGMDQ